MQMLKRIDDVTDTVPTSMEFDKKAADEKRMTTNKAFRLTFGDEEEGGKKKRKKRKGERAANTMSRVMDSIFLIRL